MRKDVAAISGAQGFVGSHLQKALKERDIIPFTIYRELFYSPVKLQQALEEVQPTYIFHLAAYGNMPQQQNIDEILRANLLGTMSLLSASCNVPYRAFINVSTSSVNLAHETFYSATKAGAERLCDAFMTQYKKPILTMRPYSLYGEGEADFRFIPTVFRSCLTGEAMDLSPNPVHDWTYVGDFVEQMIYCADNMYAMGKKVANFGTGKATSNAKVVTMIEELTGRGANIARYLSLRAYDTVNWSANSFDDYITKTSLKEGLKKYYASIEN